MNILNKANSIRLLLTISFVVMLVLPLSAQEKEDSVFTFRFFKGKDMFFVPAITNGVELSKLFDIVEQNKQKISNNEIALRVDGYYISEGKNAETRKTAKIRSNRVKSELITRKGLKEENFITRNQSGKANYVTVRLFDINNNNILYKQPEEILIKEEDSTQIENVPITTDQESTESKDSLDLEPVLNQESEETTIIEPGDKESDSQSTPGDSSDIRKKEKKDSRFALKTNLVAYGVLMPNLEIEWKFADRWSVALEGQRAWYSKENPHKVYRLATVIPEVRFWPIERTRWNGMYVGAFGGTGLYDLSNGGTGHEGEGWMVGVSAGYMWPISNHLSLDAGIGLGFLRAEDKEYKPLDGHFLYQLTKNINYFGPLRLKLSLVWRIPR